MQNPVGEPAPFPSADPLVDPHATPADRNYCTLLHASTLLWMVGIPIIGPLVMWLIRRKDSPFIDDHGKDAVNFNISVTIYTAIGVLLTLTGVLACLGIPILLGVSVLMIIGAVMGAVAAGQGRYFRYPMCIRLIR